MPNKPRVQLQVDIGKGVPVIIKPGAHSGESGSDYDTPRSNKSSSTPSTATPTTATSNKVRRRSRAARRSTGITPTEADLDTPDKVDEVGLSPISTPKSSKSERDPLTKMSGATSLLVPDIPVYRVPAKPKPPTSPKPDKVARLTKELASMRRKIEENDCMLIQGLEELRRKDLNIRALDKTQQRLASTLTQLERDIEKMTTTQAENDKFTKENASLIRVIGKLSNKVHKPR